VRILLRLPCCSTLPSAEGAMARAEKHFQCAGWWKFPDSRRGEIGLVAVRFAQQIETGSPPATLHLAAGHDLISARIAHTTFGRLDGQRGCGLPLVELGETCLAAKPNSVSESALAVPVRRGSQPPAAQSLLESTQATTTEGRLATCQDNGARTNAHGETKRRKRRATS